MPYYRAVTDLKFGDKIIPRNRIFFYPPEQKNIAKLFELGHVSAVHFPPLSAIPKWKTKAAKLEKWLVITVDDFLVTKPCDLADWLGTSKEHVEKLKDELIETYMIVPFEKPCCK